MRIGVNLNDDLLKRMGPLKSITNISQICRNAITVYVEAYERAMKRAQEDGMSDIAIRLGNSIIPQQVDWEFLGIEDAKIWVQLAKREDFEELIYRLEVIEKQGRVPYDVPIPRVQGVKVFEMHLSDYDDWFSSRIEADNETNPYTEAKLEYQRGKVSYLLSVWNMAIKIANTRFQQESLNRLQTKKEIKNKVEIPEKLLKELE